MSSPRDVAAIRLDNALILFDEFVRAMVKQADAATLRGLERRFAERLQIQPSYWSQIKGRSRQIGERLARQFEQCCHKPQGWMDQPQSQPGQPQPVPEAPLPQDDDERFIVGLVLTYYRRHPQRARTRLLDLLGEVLMPPAPAAAPPSAAHSRPATSGPLAAKAKSVPTPAGAEDPTTLWRQVQTGIAPLKKKR